MTDAQLDEQIVRKAENLASSLTQYDTFGNLRQFAVQNIAKALRETAADAYELGKAAATENAKSICRKVHDKYINVPKPPNHHSPQVHVAAFGAYEVWKEINDMIEATPQISTVSRTLAAATSGARLAENSTLTDVAIVSGSNCSAGEATPRVENFQEITSMEDDAPSSIFDNDELAFIHQALILVAQQQPEVRNVVNHLCDKMSGIHKTQEEL